MRETHRLPRETPTVDCCKNYGKRDRIRGRGVPSGNGSCLLLTGGRGSSVSDSKVCHGGMEGVNRGMDTEMVGHVANRALLFWWVHDSSGNQLGAQRRAYGKRDVDGRPRVRLDSGNPATKGDESKTREDIEAKGTATTKPTSSHFPFRPYHHSHDSSAQRPCIYILSCNVIICPFTSVYSIKASTPTLDTQKCHHLMLSFNSIVVGVPVLVVLIMSRSPQMPSRSDFSGRVIKGVVKHCSIACRTFHPRVTILAVISRGRIHSRFPGVGTIWDGQVTVEASHGIHGVVFLMVPALACAISGNDGKEVELNRIESVGTRRRRKGNVLGI